MHWLITLLAAASPVAAATFTVTNTNDSGAGSLRDAIAQANASGAVDTIDFDAALSGQTIALSLPSLEITGEDTIDASGLANPVTLDGQDAMRILIVRDSAVGMVFKSLRFVDGRTTSSFSGSAVLNQGFSVFIDCEFVGNRTRDTGDGGAILNQGILWLTRCLLNQNSAGADGGAIYNEDAGTLQTVLKAIDCTFSHNAAGTTSANQGGACYSDANTGSTFIGCTFNNNTASSSGGAIFDAGSLTVINSTFYLNSGVLGGAIRLPSASAGADIIHCTIVSNTATTGDGGGIANDATGVTLTNTVCYGNNGSSGFSDLDGDITTEGGNLIGAHSTGILTNNGFPILSSDPLLTPLADNGGPTLTMRPTSDSPVFDAGESASLPADVEDLDGDSNTSEPLPIDQRGQARVEGDAVDLGAVELPVFLLTLQQSPSAGGGISLSGGLSAGILPGGSLVTLTPSPNAGYAFSGWSGPGVPAGEETSNPLTITMDQDRSIVAQFAFPGVASNTNDSGLGSLREAIADASPGDTITFDSSLSGSLIFLTSCLTIDKEITIDASALSSPPVLQGNGSSRVVCASSNDAVTLRALEIEGGSGGILNQAADLRIEDCWIRNNDAVGNSGGGILCQGGTTSIVRTGITDNNASLAGGLFVDFGAICRIANSGVARNTAEIGGGIVNYGNLAIVNTKVSENSQTTTFPIGPSAGGILNEGGSLDVDCSEVSLNQDLYPAFPGLRTGGIYSHGGSVAIHNTIISENTSTNSGINEDIEGPFTGSHNIIGTFSATVGVPGYMWGGVILPFHIPPSEPIDSGDASLLPADELDLDADGNTTEPLPLDLFGQPRVAGSHLDIGVREYQSPVTFRVLSITYAGPAGPGMINLDLTVTSTPGKWYQLERLETDGITHGWFPLPTTTTEATGPTTIIPVTVPAKPTPPVTGILRVAEHENEP